MSTDLDSTSEILEQEQIDWERRHRTNLRHALEMRFGKETAELLVTLVAEHHADELACVNARLRRLENAVRAAGASLDEYQAVRG